MVTMRAYTTIEQSRKLAEILPLKSADMWYQHTGISFEDGSEKPIYFPMVIRDYKSDEDIPCWSLAALEHLIWNTNVNAVSCPHIYFSRIENGYYILYGNYETNAYASIVDACYEMILKLHKLNLL